jgi:hypothetical protein
MKKIKHDKDMSPGFICDHNWPAHHFMSLSDLFVFFDAVSLVVVGTALSPLFHR